MKQGRKDMRPFTGSLSDLPNEVTCNILCRLPIKSCLISKLVCKEWHDIIVSPHFSDLRRSYGSSHGRVTLLHHFQNTERKWNFAIRELDTTFADVDRSGYIRVEAGSIVRFNCNPDLNFSKKRMFVGNVCNGFICLEGGVWGRNFFVINLLTSQSVMVEHDISCRGYGLGFCSVTNQLKVLVFLDPRGDGNFVTQIQTLGTHTWRSVAGAPQYGTTGRYKSGPLLHGSLHFHCRGDGVFKGISAFEFGREQFSSIATPDEFSMKEQVVVTVLDSCLCFCCNSDSEDGPKTEVWLMKKHGIGDSWVRQFVVPNVRTSYWPVQFPYVPIVLMDDGKILFKHSCSDALDLYDPKTGKCEEVKIRGAFACAVMMTCDAYFSLGVVR